MSNHIVKSATNSKNQKPCLCNDNSVDLSEIEFILGILDFLHNLDNDHEDKSKVPLSSSQIECLKLVIEEYLTDKIKLKSCTCCNEKVEIKPSSSDLCKKNKNLQKNTNVHPKNDVLTAPEIECLKYFVEIYNEHDSSELHDLCLSTSDVDCIKQFMNEFSENIPERERTSTNKITLTERDLQNMKCVISLFQKENEMRKSIREMEVKEKSYQELLKMNKYNQEKSECDSNMDLQTYLNKTNEHFQNENKKLKRDLLETRQKLKEFLNSVEGPIKQQLDEETNLRIKLESQIETATSLMQNSQDQFLDEINAAKIQFSTTCSIIDDLIICNRNLKSDLNALEKKYKVLESDRTKQKQQDCKTINRLKKVIDKKDSNDRLANLLNNPESVVRTPDLFVRDFFKIDCDCHKRDNEFRANISNDQRISKSVNCTCGTSMKQISKSCKCGNLNDLLNTSPKISVNCKCSKLGESNTKKCKCEKNSPDQLIPITNRFTNCKCAMFNEMSNVPMKITINCKCKSISGFAENIIPPKINKPEHKSETIKKCGPYCVRLQKSPQKYNAEKSTVIEDILDVDYVETDEILEADSKESNVDLDVDDSVDEVFDDAES